MTTAHPTLVPNIAEFFHLHVRYEPLDSINLIFRSPSPDAIDANQFLRSILDVLDTDGWGTRTFQTSHYLFVAGSVLSKEQSWRVKPNLPFSPRRYHIRFWIDGPQFVLASAHYEISTPGHRVRSFDDGRRVVRDVFQAAGWTAADNFQQLGHRIVYPACDGSITMITR